MKNLQDTIAAIATAQGEGGIAIIRVSGPQAEAVLRGAFRPAHGPKTTFRSHMLRFGHLVDAQGHTLDEVMAVLMRAPNTYTRQDVAEIHCHGGRAAAQTALNRVLELGARMAESGEFTLRAFLNGRIDLSQAEAVMSLIQAGSQAAQRASVRQLEGGVTFFIGTLKDRLTGILGAIEAADDFPEEIDEQQTAQEVRGQVLDIRGELSRGCDERGARIIREGVRVALCGRPNVGKSSLMNALLGSGRAIVTAVPGTTRDVLTERMSIQGIAIELSDTAGQRETEDPVEAIGVDRARQEQKSADVVLMLLDGSAPLSQEDLALLQTADERTILVRSKCDLPQNPWKREETIELSAATGEGIEALREAIGRRAGAQALGEEQLVIGRHIECAKAAQAALGRAVEAIDAGLPLDVAAVDLWEARRALGEITGEDASEEVISDIFARFCVGK